MAKEKSRGKKVRCPKCGAHFYDLGRKFPRCPKCHKASLIKAGSIAQVRLGIKSGGYDNIDQGWTDGCATRNQAGAVYLNCQFEVIDGEFFGRKFTSLIGLYTPKGAWWGNKGRKTLRGILNSAYSLSDGDYSARAVTSRYLNTLSAFDGIEFIAEIDLRKGTDGLERNELKAPITPDDPRFEEFVKSNSTSISSHPKNEAENPLITDPTQEPGFMPMWLCKV